jgi:hypothetical protein
MLDDAFHFGYIHGALKQKLKARMEYAKFLQDSTKEMDKLVLTSSRGNETYNS